jgi:thioredoxin reductase (NADPH)
MQRIQYYFYSLPLLFIFWGWWLKLRRARRGESALQKAQEAGIPEPSTLHPVIEQGLCIGCGACVKACPEGEVLTLVKGKATLIDPSHCIGHGACSRSCPFDAISLVFGSATRGVDIPHVDEYFETNIPGIFIAGELGGMGLIRNAIEQGRQAMESIAKRRAPPDDEECLDVVIIGAGPAGFASTLAASQHKLRYVTLEQDSLGGTVFKFPRGKIVMTAPVQLPRVGKVKVRETTKEALLEMWQGIEMRTDISINYQEKMETIHQEGERFVVESSKGRYITRNVLLAIGRRGTPRRLEVPGEDSPKVVYSLLDPEQYRGSRVLVVGGGDAALEAALAVAEQAGSTVTLSYRGEAFTRVKGKNRQRLAEAEEAQRVLVLLKSQVQRIDADKVLIAVGDEIMELPNDVVIVCVGGVLPSGFLKQIGINVETKYGTA